jgi:hypothetical protein
MRSLLSNGFGIMRKIFGNWRNVFLLTAACGIAGPVVAAWLPFSFKQAVVRTLTGATMPTTSRELGQTVYYGVAMLLAALTGFTAALALRWSRFPLWLMAFSWLAVLFAFAARYFPLHIRGMILPLGHMAFIAGTHFIAARRLAADRAITEPVSITLRQPVLWIITAAMLLGMPCTFALPFAGTAFGTLPQLLHRFITMSSFNVAAAVVWMVFLVIYGASALLTAFFVVRAWMLLSTTARAGMAVVAVLVLTIVGINFPMRWF